MNTKVSYMSASVVSGKVCFVSFLLNVCEDNNTMMTSKRELCSVAGQTIVELLVSSCTPWTG